MKKNIMLVLLLFVLVVPASHVTAVEWRWAYVSSMHQKLLDGSESYFMTAKTGIDTLANVRIKGPGGDVPLVYDCPWLDGSYQYVFNAYTPPFPPPGNSYEGSYRFYVSTSDYRDVVVPTGSIHPLPLVVPTTSGGIHPTVTWDAVAGVDQYQFRLLNPLSYKQYLFYDIITANNSTSYSYTYQGDLFSQYDTLMISIEARDLLLDYPSHPTINRSRTYYLYTVPVPEPATMLLLGLGLMGLAGVRRKLKK